MKRLFDFVAAAGALLIFSPLLLLLAVLVRIKLGSPVLFRQERPGRDGKPFRLIKFRSMSNERDAAGNLMPDEIRLKPFGQWLRSTSLDELPELWNVLCGEMSLVGPRPLLMRYLGRYSPEQNRRHAVRPGLTGWAQVNGRNATTWEERLSLDVWYVDHRSFWLDLRILWRTVMIVLKREGIKNEAHITMPEFQGTSENPRSISAEETAGSISAGEKTGTISAGEKAR